MARPGKRITKERKNVATGHVIIRPNSSVHRSAPPESFFHFFHSRVSLLIFFWAAFGAVTLTFPNFSWLFPSVASHLPFEGSFLVSGILFIGMVLTIRFLPEKSMETDWTPGVSRFLLLVCLGLGATLRLYHATNPMGSYSIDCGSDISTARHMADLANYQGLSAILNGLLPLWVFTGFSLWHLF